MERRLNFTVRSLEALPVTEDRVSFIDTKERGLRIQMEPGGTKTFFWFRKINGQRTRKFIGHFPEFSIEQARDKAREYNSANAKWKSDEYRSEANPFERGDVNTLQEVLEDYLSKKKRKRPEKARKLDQDDANRYLAPLLSKRVSQISRADVHRLHVEIGERKNESQKKPEPLHRTANKTVQFLRRLINWAINEMGYRGENPVPKGKTAKDFWYPEPERKRFLKPDEAPRFLAAIVNHPSQDFRDYVILSVATGARMNDILSMRWDDLSLGGVRPTWNVPERSTKEKPYTIDLVTRAAETLIERRESSESEWVFPSDRGKKHRKGHITTVKTAWRTFLRDAELRDFTRHDMRHTFASYMAIEGASLPKIQRALGQKSSKSAERYVELTDQSVKQAADAGVKGLLTAGEAKLTEEKPRKARKK